MSYESFKSVIKKQIIEYMPVEYKNCEVKIYKVAKVNREVDALSIVALDCDYSPVLYMQDLYEDFKSGNYDMDKFLEKIAKSFESGFRDFKPAALKYESAKDNIFLHLINTEKNREF